MNNMEYKEGIIFTIFNYVAWFVLANLYFLVSNILFIVYIITFGLDITSNAPILLFISLIPMGPSITAICASMGKIIREKDINITKYYFRSYKINFRQSLKVWCMELSILLVSYIDFKLAVNGATVSSFSIFFIIVCIYTLALGTIIFPIISRFEFRNMDVIKIAFIYSIKKIHITVLNIFTTFTGFYLIFAFPGLIFLCLMSLISFSIMYNTKGIIKEIEIELSLNQ